MLNFNSILLSSENPKDLVEFYKKVLEKDPEWDMGGYSAFQAGDALLIIGPHDKIHGKSTQPERIIINFVTEDIEKDFDRIKGLGAKEIAAPYQMGENADMQIATLSDPDGNYFQLTTPMEEMEAN
ncbi:MAG TPA: VOC family protein [Patescibacteria group bacterium]|nr:VOC family protein [Patescibacteria group bacterium]